MFVQTNIESISIDFTKRFLQCIVSIRIAIMPFIIITPVSELPQVGLTGMHISTDVTIGTMASQMEHTYTGITLWAIHLLVIIDCTCPDSCKMLNNYN